MTAQELSQQMYICLMTIQVCKINRLCCKHTTTPLFFFVSCLAFFICELLFCRATMYMHLLLQESIQRGPNTGQSTDNELSLVDMTPLTQKIERLVSKPPSIKQNQRNKHVPRTYVPPVYQSKRTEWDPRKLVCNLCCKCCSFTGGTASGLRPARRQLGIFDFWFVVSIRDQDLHIDVHAQLSRFHPVVHVANRALCPILTTFYI